MKIRRYHVVAFAILPTLVLHVLNGLYMGPAFRISPLLFWAVDATQFMVIPALSFWALYRYGKVSPYQYGLTMPTRGADPVSFGVLCAFVSAAFVGVYLAGQVLGSVVESAWAPQTFNYGQAIPANRWFAGIAIAYLALSAGIVEEIIFRGLPYLLLSSRLSGTGLNTTYMLLTSAAFASVHWENGSRETFATFFLGLVIAALYTRVRNLWPFIVGHAFTDVLAFAGKM